MIAENVLHFARILRAAGMAVGPDRVIHALAALQAVGVSRRSDVHAALSATLLERHEQQTLFDAAFNAFWRDPKFLEQMMYAMLPKVSGRGERLMPPRQNRLADALAAPKAPTPPPPRPKENKETLNLEMAMSFSERERLQSADFDTMTAAEFDLAKRLAEQAPIPVQPVLQRRSEAAAHGRLDLRSSLQHMVRQPHTLPLAYRRPRERLPPLVVLLDISGSMDRYARLFLHYVHGLTRRHLRVQTFTFGTRLSHVTRHLQHRDPDLALQRTGTVVQDWKGGTRIATCLDDFNRHWARRVLSGNAAVLLVTDGLDRDEQGGLAKAAAQLQRLAHEVIWLNPLLRFEGFEPKAAGVRALLPHVDRFLPMHNLNSMADLAKALRQPPSTLH